jgi:hypothetical protein
MNIHNTCGQCIRTKLIARTNCKPLRVKAWCDRGSLTVSWRYEMNVDENHAFAIRCLLEKFVMEDEKKHGKGDSVWDSDFVMGGDRDGYVAVFAK